MDSAFLSVDDVAGIHQDSIDAFGGSPGLREPGALESAVMRVRTGYYPDVIAEAAALWESLSQNHPFVDGNKRTAIASMAAHLTVNGYRLEMEERSDYLYLMDLYESGRFRKAVLETWLRERAIPDDHRRAIVLGHLACFAATQSDVWIRHLFEYAEDLVNEPALIESHLAVEAQSEIDLRAREYLSRSGGAGPPAGLDARAQQIFERLRAHLEQGIDEKARQAALQLLVREACFRAADRLRP